MGEIDTIIIIEKHERERHRKGVTDEQTETRGKDRQGMEHKRQR